MLATGCSAQNSVGFSGSSLSYFTNRAGWKPEQAAKLALFSQWVYIVGNNKEVREVMPSGLQYLGQSGE
jgi:hypothetical protein